MRRILWALLLFFPAAVSAQTVADRLVDAAGNGRGLEQLVRDHRLEVKPVVKDLPLMVHVTAPATLPAGYTFEAEINGDASKLFTCEVVCLLL